MKTEWDYTSLADSYLLRPDYSQQAVHAMLTIMGLKNTAIVCDVGAGVAHLTLMLAQRGFDTSAVEPNDAMRHNGIARTASMENIRWFEGTGENTGMPSEKFDGVFFGSSFNVCDRGAALNETARILKPQAWFSCLWNHRDLSDPIQSEIENIITHYVKNYNYGARREDQASVINDSALFEPALKLVGRITHQQTIAQCVEAWRSHATLERQAGDSFPKVVSAIQAHLESLKQDHIHIPYDTSIWLAQKR
jgi:ubiquinone/menaquinone biosynthesis C-methylase UbiE